jgi:hypothetical protein
VKLLYLLLLLPGLVFAEDFTLELGQRGKNVTLTWEAFAVPDADRVHYYVMRNGTRIATTSILSATDKAGKRTQYRIDAYALKKVVVTPPPTEPPETAYWCIKLTDGFWEAQPALPGPSCPEGWGLVSLTPILGPIPFPKPTYTYEKVGESNTVTSK